MLRQRFFSFSSVSPPLPVQSSLHPATTTLFSFPHGELTQLDLKLDDTSQIAACQDAITCKFQFAGSNRSVSWTCWMGRLLRWAGTFCLSPLCACQSPSWPETSSFLFGWLFDQLSVASEWGRICGKENCVWTEHSLCHWAAGFGMQTHAQIRHNPDNLAAALGSQAYCVLLKLSFPKFTLQSSGSMKSRRVNLLHFYYLLKTFVHRLFFFFENLEIRLTVKGQKYKSCCCCCKKILIVLFSSGNIIKLYKWIKTKI